MSYLEPLVRADPATLRPIPWLARRWQWRDDGRELQIALRDDVFWHDGTPLTAGDAKFSFDVYRQDADSVVSGLFDLIESIDSESDTMLRVRFQERDGNWLLNAATLPVFSRRQYEDFWIGAHESSRTLSGFDWERSLPVGTGPWLVSRWIEGRVDFERFDRTWADPAWCDHLSVFVEEGIQDRLAVWSDRETDLIWPARASKDDAGEAELGVRHVADAASVMFAAFNFFNPGQPSGTLWSDDRVRRAASMAINRERYSQEVFAGALNWEATGAVSQPWAHDSGLVNEPYNPESAEILLAEAGWFDYDGDGIREDANGWPLGPVVIARADSRPELAAVLARVARDLAVVGIALTVEMLSAEAFAERWISTRDYDLIAYAYDQLPGFTDFDLFGSAWDVRTNAAGWNPGGYANAEADAAIEEFLGSVSIQRQAIALHRLQKAVQDDLFGLWFGFPRDVIQVAEGIEGFTPDMAWQTARTWALWKSVADA